MIFPTPAGGAPVDSEPVCGCGRFCIEHGARHELELARARAEAAEARELAVNRRASVAAAEMRERAAQMAQAARLADSPLEVANAIRSLPLEVPP